MMHNPAIEDPPSPVSRLLDAAKSHIEAGRVEAALPIYEQVAALAPDNSDVRHTLGLVCLETGRFEQAVMHIGRAVEMNPSNDAAYRSLGDALVAARQFPLAIRAYEKSCTLNPDNTSALLNLGNLFHEMDLFDRAEHAFSQILSSAPQHMQALNNLGKLFHDTGRLSQALVFYDRCLNRYPQHAQAQFNRAAVLLAMGDYQRGWEAYEWRFRRQSAASVYPHRLPTPRWQGEGFQNHRLLVHCEQGMGDVLQFMRYLPWVKQRGGDVVFEVHAPLVPLLRIQRNIDQVIAFSEKHPPTIPHDLHIPLLSLPRLFRTGTDTIPNTFPYIGIDRQSPELWKPHIRQDHLNIGLVWTSSETNPKRNLPLDRCSAWFQNPKLHFISLQKGDTARDIAAMHGTRSPITMLGDQLNNFHDTACIMKHLDLVISVDTAALHLAGGMGKPLWALLPFNADWRWPQKEENSLWYPHAEIFRQSNPGHWDDVIATVADRLQALPSEPPYCMEKTAKRRIDRHMGKVLSNAGPDICRREPGLADRSDLTALPDLYLGLVKGENYGWGVCSRYLMEELPKLRSIRLVNEKDASSHKLNLPGPLFQALTTVAFDPLFGKARGARNYGYTFFENELTRQSVENAKRYDQVLAGSTWCRDRMLEAGIPNCDVLIQGIDPKRFYPITDATSTEAKSDGRFVIFSGGKFELRKGQDILLRAVKILQEKYPDIHLVNCWYNLWPESLRQMDASPYISFTYRENESWQATLHRTYLDNGMDPNRITTMDLVPHEQLRSLYAQTDVAVFPNRCEGGTNLVLMEYMACAKPVIVTATSGHNDIVTEENALLLHQLKDINISDAEGRLIGRWQDPSLEELVAQIEYAYHHREAIRLKAQKAGSDLQRFTWRHCAERLVEIIEK